MIVECAAAAGCQNAVTKKLKCIVFAVPITALLMGTAAMALDPRLGLFGGALVFGWTQLVGL